MEVVALSDRYESAETWCMGEAMSQHKMADSDCPGNLKVNSDIISYIIILGRAPLV